MAIRVANSVHRFKAHPTKYKGVLFRSRLEATWAAFFDLMDWQWQYEPIDFEGWTPDFLLRDLPRVKNAYGTEYIHSANPFVEIKPFERDKQWNRTTEKIYKALPHDRIAVCFGLSPRHLAFALEFYDKDKKCGDSVDFMARENVDSLWNQAGNITRWKGPR